MLQKLSKLMARVLGAPAATSGRKHGQSRRFAPSIENLENRWVPATLQVNGLLAHGAEASIAEAGKVSMQDFHFVMKQNKASDAIAEAGKVSMQDFHFVMKQNKASPQLFAQSSGAGLRIRFDDILVSGYQTKGSDTVIAE